MTEEKKKQYQTFDVYNHETGESFQIYTAEMFVNWLNANDDIYSFTVRDDGYKRAETEMLEHWGERCPDFDGACIACHAWKHFDETGEIAK
jgi:hypothetical protein